MGSCQVVGRSANVLICLVVQRLQEEEAIPGDVSPLRNIKHHILLLTGVGWFFSVVVGGAGIEEKAFIVKNLLADLCPEPVVPNGMVSGQKEPDYFFREFLCNVGYRLVGNSKTIKCRQGIWSH